MVISESIDFWVENIKMLKAYRKEYGDFNVPINWKKNLQFSRWVENIRKHPKKLPLEYYNQLKKIGFDFHIASNWETMFLRLKAFYKKHGDSYVPPLQHEHEDLFDWTINQRRAKSYLTSEQIKKLNTLDFEWDILSDSDIKWQEKYQELVSFKKQHGHARVPQYYKTNPKLGDWVSKQRRSKTIGKLSKDRTKKLNELGFLWKEDIAKMQENAWETRYQELVEYKKLNGHIDRIKIIHEKYTLGLWISTQMAAKKRLSPERKRKLNAIEFIWVKGNLREERWAQMYAKLKAFKAKHGHCRVKQKDDFQLSVWLQRNKRDRKIIGEDKRNKLHKLGVKWPHELFKEGWELRYNELKEFKKIHGHLSVPKSNGKLHEWIETQKKYKDAHTLTKQREVSLNKLGFVWKGENEKQKMVLWESMLKKFKSLKDKYPTQYNIKLKTLPELDNWVGLQLHNKKKLSAAKRERLNEIGFSWSKNYHHELWEQKYAQLIDYKKKYGNCDVPQKFPKNQPLASWVNGQRTKNITTAQRAKLNKIGFSWKNEVLDKRWNLRLNELNELKKKKLRLSIEHHPVLYSWAYQQRKNFKSLSRDRKKLLLKAGLMDK